MLIFLLESITDTGYDTVDGCVVVARDNQSAREIAARNAGQEGSDVWLSDEKSTCLRIGVADSGPARLVLDSYIAG